MRYPSFDRARRFGRRAVGLPLAVYLSGTVSAAILILLVLLVPVLTELLAMRGTLTVALADQAELRQFGAEPDSTSGQTAVYEHRGLLPTVWRLRQSWLGPTYAAVYSSWGAVRGNHSCLLVIVSIACLLVLLAVASLAWLEVAVNKAALRAVTALRGQIHDQAHRLGAGDLFLGQRSTAAELFTLTTDDLRIGLAAWWRVVPHSVVFLMAMLALALSVDFWLTLATVLLVALIWWIFNEIRQRARHKRDRLADAADRFLGPVLEHLEQNRAISNLAADWAQERQAFDEDLQRYDHAALARETTAAIVKPLMVLLVLLGVSFVLLLAGYNVLGEPPRVSLAEAVLLGAALCATGYPVFRFERLLEVLPKTDQAASRIFVYLDRGSRVGQLPHAVPLEHLWRQISFQNVTLADMQGQPLLDAVSFELPAKSQTAIFCSEEGTPRAVASLLARFCDPAAGRVLFDRQDLSHVTLSSVQHQVAVILADHLLVGGSLRDNIVGPAEVVSAARDAEIIEALKQVHAYEFVQPLPEGLETPVGPQGVTLSAGQAIRLGLARVVLKQSSVLVIEEPRDDLDQITAERIADALDRVSQNRTLVVLARRLPTLRAAERILLFHEGRLLADGTHQELLQSNEIYRHLNYVRFNEFRDQVK